MKFRFALRTHLPVLTLGLCLACAGASRAAAPNPTRKGDEDVKSATFRTNPGLAPGGGLLFNGWGVTPAGEQVAISDMAVKMVLSPDKKTLLAASAGFSDTGLTLFDLAGKRVTQFLPLPRVWNGLAFSLDGRRVFVPGGDSGAIHVFTYADGKATSVGPTGRSQR